MSSISNVITQARRQLQDTVSPYRHSDEELVDNFNGAMREAYRIRPDLFLGLSYTYTTYTTSDLALDFPLSDFLIPQFVAYITGFTELVDDEYAVDGRAMALLNRFSASLLNTV